MTTGTPDRPAPPAYAAIVLAGGTGRRLGGADKARLELAGRSFLDWALDACAEAAEVVVVGPEPVEGSPDRAGVRWAREDPPGGGPAAGLLAGLDALRTSVGWVFVMAVDMPLVSRETVRRLLETAAGGDGAARDGAILLGPDGRRQLAAVLDLEALARARPRQADGLPVHRLLAALDLREVAALDGEHADVDTAADLDLLRRRD